MLQLSPGKTPARGGGGGPLPGTKGTKAARGRMQSWKNPSGRRGGGGRGGAAGAQQPGRPHQPPGGAALGPCPRALLGGGAGASGKQNMPAGRVGLGTESQSPQAPDAVGQPARRAHPVRRPLRGGWPHSGHTRRCTRPPGRCGSRWWPASRGRAQTQAMARTCVPRRTPSCTHMIAHTHVLPDTRASRSSQGREKERVPPSGAEIDTR